MNEHFDGDGCDMDDPHDVFHHESGPRTGPCNHPDCRADDLNDDAKVGLP